MLSVHVNTVMCYYIIHLCFYYSSMTLKDMHSVSIQMT